MRALWMRRLLAIVAVLLSAATAFVVPATTRTPTTLARRPVLPHDSVLEAVQSAPPLLSSLLCAQDSEEAKQSVIALLLALLFGLPAGWFIVLDLVDLEDKRGSGKFGGKEPPVKRGLKGLLNDKK